MQLQYCNIFKDTHRENSPSNKTQALRKCMNVEIWLISELNQLFIRESDAQVKLSKKKKVVSDNTPILQGFSTDFKMNPLWKSVLLC